MYKFACYIGDARPLLARRVSAGILYVFQGCATQPGATGRTEMVCDSCASLYQEVSTEVLGSSQQG